MVLLERIELSLPPYQRGVLPFNYKSLAGLRGIEPLPAVSKTVMISISPKPDYVAPGVGIEPTIAESKSVVLPLHYPGTNKTGCLFFN